MISPDNSSYAVQKTSAEMAALHGPDWLVKLGVSPSKRVLPEPKARINAFEEFPEDAQDAYITLFEALKNSNPTDTVELHATGSRINGHWRTRAEAEAIANSYTPPRRVKYSDFDFVTNATTMPDLAKLESETGYKFDRVFLSEKQCVRIPDTLTKPDNKITST